MDEIKLKKLEKLISDYKTSHPNVIDEEIISIMCNDSTVKKEDVAQLSMLLANPTQQSGDSCNFSKTPTQKTQTKSVIVKSKDGKNYNLNKTIELRLNKVSSNISKQEKSNGFIGKAWSGFKNLTVIGDSSDDVRKLLENEQKLLNAFNSNTQKRPQIFKELTGVDYTPENLEKFIKGQIKLQSEIALNKYKDGQEMAVDITSDIASGFVAYGTAAACIAGGIAAAPFTAGASLGAVAVGVGIAAGAGAATKVAIKAADANSGGREYTLKEAGKDAVIGGVSGALAPVTLGAGGAVANTTAKVAPKFIANTARYSVEGAMFGAADGGTRAALEGESLEDIAVAAGEGALGGALVGNIMGHGGSAIGKGLNHFKANVRIPHLENKISAVEKFVNGEIDIEYVSAILRNPEELEAVFVAAEKTITDKAKLAQCKTQIIKHIDDIIMDHGSLVMQTKINPSRVKVDTKTGVKYVEMGRDDVMLAASVPSKNSVAYLERLINAGENAAEKETYLSLSLINKNADVFYHDSKYGVIVKNRSSNATSAGFGQISNYNKDFNTYISQFSFKLKGGDGSYHALQTYFIESLQKRGYNITEKEFVDIFKKLCNKETFDEITEDIIINGQNIKAKDLRFAAEESNCELAGKILAGDASNTEVTSIIDGVDAIYARCNSIEEVDKSILELAKKKNKYIYLLGEPQDCSYRNSLEYIAELSKLKSETPIKNLFTAKANLYKKYEHWGDKFRPQPSQQ